MGSACCKGKGAKKDKNGKECKEVIEEENNDKLNVEEIKIESQEETKSQDVVDIEQLGSPIRERKRPIDANDQARIHQAVIEAVASTKGLVTLPQVEAYISNKYRNFPINPYRRRSIFTKVIADEFYKGQLAVKTNKHCS